MGLQDERLLRPLAPPWSRTAQRVRDARINYPCPARFGWEGQEEAEKALLGTQRLRLGSDRMDLGDGF